MQISDFFNSKTAVSGLATDDYVKTEMIVDMAKAFVRTISVGIYIIDYCLKDIIYVSDNIAQRYGIPIGTIHDKNYGHYLEYVAYDDYQMLLDINDKVFDFFNQLPTEDILKHTVIYDFHLNGHLVEQHYTPVALRNGKVWLALCTISLSSHKKSGNLLIQHTESPVYYEYSNGSHSWISKRMKPLTDTEKSVLMLSAQGFTTEETAQKLSKSTDTIKSYRKRVMKKFNSSSISEALMFGLNHNML